MSNNDESNGGNLTFDKKAYQRELMRKRRTADKMKKDLEARGDLTESDKLFDADRPGWYIFGGLRTTDRAGEPLKCWMCGTGFTTRLEMNKFCSPKCKDAYLDSAALRKP